MSNNAAKKQEKAQEKAARQAAFQAEESAKRQEKAADEAANRANTKRADSGAVVDAAAQAGRGGVSGTMLTGPQGVSPDALQLGRTTLLGM
jgi:hypothetical protein